MAKRQWRIPAWAYRKYQDSVFQLTSLDPDSEVYAAIVDEIRSLPNFPRDANETDLIVPHITTIH